MQFEMAWDTFSTSEIVGNQFSIPPTVPEFPENYFAKWAILCQSIQHESADVTCGACRHCNQLLFQVGNLWVRMPSTTTIRILMVIVLVLNGECWRPINSTVLQRKPTSWWRSWGFVGRGRSRNDRGSCAGHNSTVSRTLGALKKTQVDKSP